ncbi:MAG: C69 family dipeptidase [Firmicutes bacterium]|jgi:dipeptidase|nr:C69 family dipeptidase [Bacillota bacterium]
MRKLMSVCVTGLALVFTVIVFTLPALADCSSIIVGRNATVDGSVLLGHNEDNGGRIVMPQYIVPRMTHEPGEVIRFENGGTTPQVPVTWAFIWSQTPGGSFSDLFINEWGVAIASDNCGSTKEDGYDVLVARGDITDGGIGYHIRRIVAERARTAREGVELAAKLAEEFGYIAAGRSYQIADANEGWLLHLVRGKHYVAQRVPDDKVVFIPNQYVIREVDLSDTENFIASPDLIEYAIKRGWYDPADGKPFDFSTAYQAPATGKTKERGYDTRQWRAHQLITGETPKTTPLPFAVTPSKKMSVSDVAKILRDHYEGTPYDKTDGYKTSPHWTDERVICTSSTQESSVVQLRAGLPDPMKAVYWRTTGRPDTSPYVPWYLGITSVPDGYFWADPSVGNSFQFKPHAALYDYDPTKAWWTFETLQTIVDGQYGDTIDKVCSVWETFEEEMLADQATVERTAQQILAVDQEAGIAFLTSYTNSLAQRALRQAKDLIAELPTVKIDIQRQSVKLSETGTIKVSILSSPLCDGVLFDPKSVKLESVTLGPAYRNPGTWVKAKGGVFEDVNSDGVEDLVAEFDIGALAKLISPVCYTDMWLSATTDSGTPLVGWDLVNFMP